MGGERERGSIQLVYREKRSILYRKETRKTTPRIKVKEKEKSLGVADKGKGIWKEFN